MKLDDYLNILAAVICVATLGLVAYAWWLARARWVLILGLAFGWALVLRVSIIFHIPELDAHSRPLGNGFYLLWLAAFAMFIHSLQGLYGPARRQRKRRLQEDKLRDAEDRERAREDHRRAQEDHRRAQEAIHRAAEDAQREEDNLRRMRENGRRDKEDVIEDTRDTTADDKT